MADATTPTTLGNALSGLRITGAENPYGIALLGLTQAAPSLYNPYGKPGANFGIALGQALLSGLLGYQAKKQATEESIQASDLATQLIAKPAAERATFLKALEQQDTRTNVLSRLTDINPILLQNELAAKANGQQFNQQLMLKGIEQGLIPTGKESLFGGTGTSGDGFLTTKKAEEYDKIRSQFNALPEVKNFSLVKNAAAVVGQAVKDPSAVATQELVRRAVQLIEPGMAVREGEQAAIMSSQSIPEQWKGALQKAVNGEGGLGTEVREGILRIAQRSYEAQANSYNDTKAFYDNLAKDRGLGKHPISYLGDAPTFEEVINSLSKKQTSTGKTTAGTTTPPAQATGMDQSKLNEIATRLSQLSAKGKDNLTLQENQELDKLANDYRNLKYGGSK